MIALKEKADKELLQYNMELKELIRIIDHDRKLKEFMRVKGEERADLADKELGVKQRKKESERDKGDREETVEVWNGSNILTGNIHNFLEVGVKHF